MVVALFLFIVIFIHKQQIFMDNIYTRIIREEISRLILSEVLDVSPLKKYVQPLQKCVSELRDMGYTKNKEINAFLDNICRYIVQVVFGINKCVSANSLDEDFKLSDYGIQYPAELGGNLWNDFEASFYKGANSARRQLNKSGYINNDKKGNNKEDAPIGDDTNNVPSVKLEESLRNLSQISLRYQEINNKYPNEISQYANPIYSALSCISNLNNEFREIKANAQGTNP